MALHYVTMNFLKCNNKLVARVLSQQFQSRETCLARAIGKCWISAEAIIAFLHASDMNIKPSVTGLTNNNYVWFEREDKFNFELNAQHIII